MRLGAMNPEEPFSGVTVPINIEYSQNRVNEVIESSRELFTKEWKDIVVPVKLASKIEEKIVKRPVQSSEILP